MTECRLVLLFLLNIKVVLLFSNHWPSSKAQEWSIKPENSTLNCDLKITKTNKNNNKNNKGIFPYL